WRRHRDHALLDVCLEVTHDLIGDRCTTVLILKVDDRPEHHLLARVEPRDINHLGRRQQSLQLGDAPFGETLQFTRRMVFGVFLQVAVGPCLGNRRDDARAIGGFQLFQFRAQAFGTGFGDRWTTHALSSLCNSCRLCTSPSPRKSSECTSARAPATVVEYVTRCCKASRRIEKESAIACFPSVVLTI